jgi:hypothetical protein
MTTGWNPSPHELLRSTGGSAGQNRPNQHLVPTQTTRVCGHYGAGVRGSVIHARRRVGGVQIESAARNWGLESRLRNRGSSMTKSESKWRARRARSTHLVALRESPRPL